MNMTAMMRLKDKGLVEITWTGDFELTRTGRELLEEQDALHELGRHQGQDAGMMGRSQPPVPPEKATGR